MIAVEQTVAGRADHACVDGEVRSEEHTSELQSHSDLVCRLLLEKKKKQHGCAPRCFTGIVRVCGRCMESADFAPHGRQRAHGFFSLRCFFFNDTATTEIYTLSLHDALPI